MEIIKLNIKKYNHKQLELISVKYGLSYTKVAHAKENKFSEIWFWGDIILAYKVKLSHQKSEKLYYSNDFENYLLKIEETILKATKPKKESNKSIDEILLYDKEIKDQIRQNMPGMLKREEEELRKLLEAEVVLDVDIILDKMNKIGMENLEESEIEYLKTQSKFI